MLTTNNILSQLPEFIAADPYVREILLAKEGEFNTIEEVQADILAQFKVDTATWGLTWWERSLGLPTPTNPLGYYEVEQNDPILKYYGEWETVDLRNEDENFNSNNSNNSDGFIKRCKAKDANWMEFSFYGTGFKLFRSCANRETSSFFIVVDGKEEYMLKGNHSNANPVYNWCFYEKQNLNLGIHTVRLYAEATSASNPKFVLDKIQINNNIDTNYESRRKRIKSKLIPITNVTNDAIRELAKSYGFDILIDESVPYVYSIDFEQNANVDAGLRRQLLLDLEQIIPSHIQLDSKFFVSTFYDIEQHNLTWNEAYQIYSFYDFLTNSKPDVFGKYNHLYKYDYQSKFNFAHFNDDLMATDTIYKQHIIDKAHDTSFTNIKHENITYSDTIPTNVVNKFNDVNKKLLSDQKRNTLTRMSNRKAYNSESVVDVVNEFKEAKNNLLEAVTTHNYLAHRPGDIEGDSFTDILARTSEFTKSYSVGRTSVTPEQVRKGKVVYHQPNTSGGVNTLVRIVGTIEDCDVKQFYDEDIKQRPSYAGGGSNVMVTQDYVIPRQLDLKPENIKKGTSMFGILGTLETTPNDYNLDDVLFDWQLEEKSDSYKILC